MSEAPATTEGDQESRANDLVAGRREVPRPPAGSHGLISSINVSHPGGVPKRPIDRTLISIRGLVGDGQRTKEPIHGGPEKAVCLYGVEQIARVNADGHHLYPGAIGENLTVSGLELGALQAGDRLRIGAAESGPVIQLSGPADPCKNIAGSFEGWRIARISHKVRPEDSRWYARVLREGPVVTGDEIELLGAADTIGR